MCSTYWSKWNSNIYVYSDVVRDTYMYNAVARRGWVYAEWWRLSTQLWEHSRLIRLYLSTWISPGWRPYTLHRWVNTGNIVWLCTGDGWNVTLSSANSSTWLLILNLYASRCYNRKAGNKLLLLLLLLIVQLAWLCIHNQSKTSVSYSFILTFIKQQRANGSLTCCIKGSKCGINM